MTHGQALATIETLLSKEDVTPAQAERLRSLVAHDNTEAVSAIVELRQLRSSIDHGAYLAQVDAALDAAAYARSAPSVAPATAQEPAYAPPGELVVAILYVLSALSIVGGTIGMVSAISTTPNATAGGFMALGYGIVSAAVLATLAVIVRLLRHIAERLHAV